MNHHARNTRRRLTACVVALVGAWLAARPLDVLARDGRPSVPSVPAGLEVSSAHRPYLVGHAVGTQNYICIQKANGAFAWNPWGPQATLFSNDDEQVITHYLSANPDESGEQRPTWQHSKDSSQIWAMPIASSSDPAFAETGAIPWLLLRVVGDANGPTGGRRLGKTSYIQRVNTSGGLAPTAGCGSGNIGARALVPYTTDYYFYAERDR